VRRKCGHPNLIKYPTGPGAVSPSARVHWESDDCSGEPFVIFADSLVKEIIRIDTSSKPDPLVLLADWPRVLSTRQSKSYKPEGKCSPYPGTPSYDENTTDFTYIKPEDYGFEITPSGEWGFPPPLSFRYVQAARSNVISCDGFESCPTN
jgi:hypothetical protein